MKEGLHVWSSHYEANIQVFLEKELILLQENGTIAQYNFSEIKSLEILNEEIKKDLKFFLDTVIAGKKKDAKKIVINCESGGDDTSERNIFVSLVYTLSSWWLLVVYQDNENRFRIYVFCTIFIECDGLPWSKVGNIQDLFILKIDLFTQ